jgi:hypothetical protein
MKQTESETRQKKIQICTAKTKMACVVNHLGTLAHFVVRTSFSIHKRKATIFSYLIRHQVYKMFPIPSNQKMLQLIIYSGYRKTINSLSTTTSTLESSPIRFQKYKIVKQNSRKGSIQKK